MVAISPVSPLYLPCISHVSPLQVPVEELRAAVEAGEPALERLADKWGGLVKPDITFFGEARASD